jgi:hypothetical protein
MGDWINDAGTNLLTIQTFGDESVGYTVGDPLNQAGLGSNAWTTANLAVYFPFQVFMPFLVQKVFWANGATVSGNVDVGVYNRDGVLLFNSGSTAQATIGAIQSATPSAAPYMLLPDYYYFAVACSSATATMQGTPTSSNDLYQHCGICQQALGALPLPATWTPATITTTTVLIPAAGVTAKTTV